MKLDSYTTADVFEQLKPEWNNLLRDSPADQIFSTWEWNATWWDVFHPGQLYLLTCRDEHGALVGIAPWFIGDDRVVRAIGCEDVTDYLDVIVHKDHIADVIGCFGQHLARHREAFDFVELCNVPEASPTLAHLPQVLERQGLTVNVEQADVCPLIVLPQDWGQYLQLLDKKQRHEIRRKMRRINGIDEVVDWYIVDSTHDLAAETERFLTLMASSDVEKNEFLQFEPNRAFMRRIIPVMLENGWLQLSFLTIDGEAMASYLNFTYNRQVLVYNSGLSHERYAHISPGIILLVKNIQHAIESGYKVFDFMRGGEDYKYRMGGKDTKVFRLLAT